jgi:small subunit ribosomal protein S2
MANTLVQDLIEAGIHFGQRGSSWNPKMQRYIYGKRNGIHIIDIKETVKGLLLAKKFIARAVAEGKDVCFVGTEAPGQERHRAARRRHRHALRHRALAGRHPDQLPHHPLPPQALEELEAIEAKDNFASYSKKMESQLRREKDKIKRNLDGIRKMDKLPGAIIAIDVKSEITALKEARKLGVPTICLIDTDGDPDLADIPIPGNDDSMRSIDVIIRELCLAVAEGKQQRQASPVGREGATTPGQQDAARRSRRAQFRADDAGGDAPAAATASQAE